MPLRHQHRNYGLKDHRAQRVLVLLVFFIFLANAIGLYDITFDVDGEFRFEKRFFPRHDNGWSLPAVVRSWEFMVLTALGIILSLLLPVLNLTKASALFFVATLCVLGLGFASKGESPRIPLEQSLVTILALYMVSTVLSYVRETRRKQRIMDVFGHYVPPELVHIITQHPDHFSVAGEAREMSVMFCDVHDFTALSAQLEPRQVAQLLNALFTPITSILYQHKGTIDKYIGDAVMAFWGAPLPDPDHAKHAVMAALEIQEVLLALAPAFKSRGWPEITMGIGINTGLMCVGNMGSAFRMAYTVVGDTVNLAARLQELTRVCKAQIIVGEATKQAFPEGLYRELGLVKIRGRNTPLRIHEPFKLELTPASTVLREVAQPKQVLRHHDDCEWEQAMVLFQDSPGTAP